MKKFLLVFGLLVLFALTASATTGYVDPNGAGATLEWTPTPSGTHYTTIDDGNRQPTVPDTTNNIWYNDIVPITDIFNMTTLTGVDSVSDVNVWVFGRTDASYPGVVNVSIYMNGNWRPDVELTDFSTADVEDKRWSNASFSAPPAGSYTISDAGTTAVNGNYLSYSTNDDVENFKHDSANYYLTRRAADHIWYIATTATANLAGQWVYIASSSGQATPPIETYSVSTGGSEPGAVVSFNTLGYWTQTDLDNMQVRIKGVGVPAETEVDAMYAEVTYTAVVPEFFGIHFEWFDLSSGLIAVILAVALPLFLFKRKR